MNKKIILATISLLVIIAGYLAWNMVRSDVSKPTPISTASPSTDEITKPEPKVISVEKPASFEGVEMIVHKSQFGFEITYPKEWEMFEDVVTTVGMKEKKIERFVVKSGAFVGKVQPLLLIEIEDIDQKLSEPDITLREEKIIINESEGIYSPGLEYSDDYYFYNNGKQYRLETRNILKHYSDMEDSRVLEILWVLSTFKITD